MHKHNTMHATMHYKLLILTNIMLMSFVQQTTLPVTSGMLCYVLSLLNFMCHE